jgi:hypothetical protein
VIRWLGPNGSPELTDSTFSIAPIKASGTVMEDRADRLRVSNVGKTTPDGDPAAAEGPADRRRRLAPVEEPVGQSDERVRDCYSEAHAPPQ